MQSPRRPLCTIGTPGYQTMNKDIRDGMAREMARRVRDKIEAEIPEGVEPDPDAPTTSGIQIDDLEFLSGIKMPWHVRGMYALCRRCNMTAMIHPLYGACDLCMSELERGDPIMHGMGVFPEISLCPIPADRNAVPALTRWQRFKAWWRRAR